MFKGSANQNTRRIGTRRGSFTYPNDFSLKKSQQTFSQTEQNHTKPHKPHHLVTKFFILYSLKYVRLCLRPEYDICVYISKYNGITMVHALRLAVFALKIVLCQYRSKVIASHGNTIVL